MALAEACPGCMSVESLWRSFLGRAIRRRDIIIRSSLVVPESVVIFKVFCLLDSSRPELSMLMAKDPGSLGNPGESSPYSVLESRGYKELFTLWVPRGL